MEVAPAVRRVADLRGAGRGQRRDDARLFSLVHDDLPAMDNDDLRRGKPSTHKAFDEATAILAGDALQARAFEVLAEPDTHSDPAGALRAGAGAGGNAAGARGMAGGQMIDMLAEGKALDARQVARCRR
jgi:farnesyl diphosphate synthase